MKKIKKYITMALAGVMMLSFAGCDMIERTEESIQNTVLAKVGDTKITKGDVDEALTYYLTMLEEQYGEDYESDETIAEQLKELRLQYLDGLVDEEVLVQSAESLGVTPTDEEIQTEVDSRIAAYKEMCGNDDTQYQSFIAMYGYDDTTFEEFLKRQVLISMVYDAMIADVEVTDEDIQNYYDENIADYTTPAGADVTHVLFAPVEDADGNVTDEAKAEALAKAEAAREQILAGASLEDIANADDTATYEDLGRVAFEDSGMEQAFEDAFKVLPANEVSEIVETSYGYHIIINTAVYEEEVQALDDDLKETIRETLQSDKETEAYDAKLEELKSNLNIKTYESRLD